MSYRTVTPFPPVDHSESRAVERVMAQARRPILEPPGARGRLMAALAEVVADAGYASATISDIVAGARVSKRTFYEHFADKEACLLALYEHACAHLVAVLRAAAGAEGLHWRDHVRLAASAYLTAIEAMPDVSRTLLIEIQAAGPRAFALRRRAQRRFAQLLCDLVQNGRSDRDVRPLSPALALALVGGINELVLYAIEPYPDAGDADGGMGRGGLAGDGRITALTDTVTTLVSAVLADLDGYSPGA